MIVTNVPDSNRPTTYHQFNYLLAAGALVTVPTKIALVGAMRSTGTATAGVVYDISGMLNTDVDAMFGQSGELPIMYRMANQCATLFGRGPRITAVGVAEPGGGTANVQTLTFTGTATADGPINLTIAGRAIVANARSGDAQNAIATNVAAVIAPLAPTLPVLVTVAANVITLTHPTKGVNGGDVKVTIDKQVPGNTIALATTAAGAGVADTTAAFAALSPLLYDGIALGNHASTDCALIVTDIAARWSAGSKTWAYYFMGEPGSIGTATALSAAVNHQSFITATWRGCPNTAGEIATAAAMLVWSRSKPNAGYDHATVPLYPPAIATLYTAAEIETAILAGLTVFSPVIDATGAVTQGRGQVERMVTSRTTTSGQPDPRNRDIGVSRTGVALARQLDIASGIALGADANPDGVGQDENSDALIIDLAAAIMRAEANAGVLRKSKVEADIAAIQLEHDSVTQGRDNVLLPYHVVTPLHQVAWVHNIQIGG